MGAYVRKLLRACRKHWPALVVAMLASAYVLLPGIISYAAAGASYDGVYFSNNGDWLYYASRIRKISEGHSGGNQYLYEHAEDENVNMPGAEIALAFIVRTFNVDTIDLLLLLNIISPILTTLLFYALLFRLSKSRWVSAAIPLFLIVTNIWDLSKAIHPQINLPILLLFLYIWFGMLARLEGCDGSAPLSAELRKMWRGILACGLLLGSLYFVYFYNWSFLFVVLGCSVLLALLYRQRDIAVLNGLIVAASAPFGIPYIVLVRRVFQSPFFADLGPRYGMVYTHLPESLPRMCVAAVAVLLIALFIRRANLQKQRVALGVLCLVAANLIYPNSQIITGTSYGFAIHWSFMPVFLFSLGSAFLYPFLKRSAGKNYRWTNILAILFILLFVAASVRLSSFRHPPINEAKIQSFISVQRYGPILRFLQTSTPKDSVVLTDDKLSYIIPAFTHNFVYYINFIQCAPASNREIAERYLLSGQFNPKLFEDEELGIGIPPKWQIFWEARYHIEETPLYRFLFGEQESPYSVEKERAYAREVLTDLESSGGINAEALNRYRLDYVIWDKKLHPDWTIGNVPQFEPIFEQHDIVVYRVKFSDDETDTPIKNRTP